MRICLVYDCLYPWTIGGAERWYRLLAERLAAEGHDVTYLTMRQWPCDEPPRIPGVRIACAGPRMALYAGERRRILPPLRFGAGVAGHLARRGRDYDVVACASFPFFSTLAAEALRPAGGYRLVVDWWEVWTRRYWRDYLGPTGGEIGWLVQRCCARLPHEARTASRMHASRLREIGLEGPIRAIGGIAPHETTRLVTPAPAEPYIVFAGRHMADKGVTSIVAALAIARQLLPGLRAVVLGDGPERARVRALAEAAGLTDAVETPGFVDEATLDRTVRSALCMVLPSRREGFGLAVLDAASRGVPSVVARGLDTAAPELVSPGVNGVVTLSGDPADLADGILAVARLGPLLRASTANWWAANATLHSAHDGLRRALAVYGGISAPASPAAHGDRPPDCPESIPDPAWRRIPARAPDPDASLIHGRS